MKTKDRDPRRACAVTGGAAVLILLASCGHDDDWCCGPANPGPAYTPGYTPNSVAIADVNGDGTPDLVVATTVDEGFAQDPGLASVYLGIPATPGTFQNVVDYSTTGSNPSGIVAVALAGSGSPDMVVSNFGNGTASVFAHDPANPG